MFSRAYDIASKFTFPVIQSMRFFNGTVESGLGSFIILNNSGWILTAAHIVQSLTAFSAHTKELADYQQKVSEINNDNSLDKKHKQKKIGSLQKNDRWIINVSHWWGADNTVIPQFKVFQPGDIAIGKISNYAELPEQIYPKFRKTDDALIGTSLCKLGFPFYDIQTSFDASSGRFVLAPGSLPVPRFPIDGMATRFMVMKLPDGSSVKLLETSSPGLRGQSGGPVFDREGNICAVQLKTNHYPLGFNPEIDVNGKKTMVPQFLNVGVGVTSDTILDFIKQQGVSVDVV